MSKKNRKERHPNGASQQIAGWTPQFERFRVHRIAVQLANLSDVTQGKGEIYGQSYLGPDARAMMAQTVIKLTATELDLTDLHLFTKSAFVMSACLLVEQARISEECFPSIPLWIEYDHPRHINAPVLTMWFHCPLQEKVIEEARKQGNLTTREQKVSMDLLAYRMQWGQAWLLEVYGPHFQPIGQLQYNVKQATWGFGPGHVHFCPSGQCRLEILGDGGFIVPCDSCQKGLDLTSRMFVTSLLLRAGLFRSPQKERDGQEAREGAERRSHLQKKLPTASGYVVIEFDASVCRRDKKTTPSRPYWAEGRKILDLNALEETLPDDAIVQVELTYRGIERTLRSDYFVHKKGQTIPVREYTAQVKMTYATYQRRLQNKRITKVVACQFACLSLENLPHTPNLS